MGRRGIGMDSTTIVGIGILLLVLISFVFNQIILREINAKNQQNMNGISHVWGTLMELKLDLKLLESKALNPDSSNQEAVVENMEASE
jgi:hypothetical protein|tara:strand:- start:1188 stop:1451 length:264 start_codon:yes stop_codon:yes gene_type:complete